MSIESALAQYEYECWCNYNHEYIDENGNWISDEETEETEELI